MKKLKKNQKISLTGRQITKIKEDARNESIIFARMFSMLVLRDKFSFGQKRLVRFIENFDEELKAYSEGYIELIDIADMLREETKIDMRGEKL